MDSLQPGGLTRRDFVIGLGAFFASQVFLPRTLGSTGLTKGLKPLRIGFLTDCHAMLENDAPSALSRTAELKNALNPDIIIGGGDFVHGGFYDSGKKIDLRWGVADRFLRSLRPRMEPMIGNHDFNEPLLPDGSPAPHDPRWRWRHYFGLDQTYRSFSFHGYRFLMLDSVKVIGGANPYRGWIDAAQLAWLDYELARIPRNQPIILCSHIPFKTSVLESFAIVGPGAGRVRVVNAHLVMEKLRDRPLALILQGHVHVNERLEWNGIPCITGGAVCGKWWQGPNGSTWPGVGIIEMLPSTTPGERDGGTNWSYLNTPPAKVPSEVA